VFRALRGYKVLLAQPGLLVLQGLLEKLVLRGLKVYKVRLGPLARQVKLVLRDLRVSKEKPDPKAHRVSKERLGLKERQDCRVQ
jgi:hypothetical protein